MKKLFFALVSVLFISSISFSQNSDPNLRRVGFLTGNNLSLSFYNDGQISGFSLGTDIRGKWKGNDYIGDIIPLIGVELPIKVYNNGGEVIIVYQEKDACVNVTFRYTCNISLHPLVTFRYTSKNHPSFLA